MLQTPASAASLEGRDSPRPGAAYPTPARQWDQVINGARKLLP